MAQHIDLSLLPHMRILKSLDDNLISKKTYNIGKPNVTSSTMNRRDTFNYIPKFKNRGFLTFTIFRLSS